MTRPVSDRVRRSEGEFPHSLFYKEISKKRKDVVVGPVDLVSNRIEPLLGRRVVLCTVGGRSCGRTREVVDGPELFKVRPHVLPSYSKLSPWLSTGVQTLHGSHIRPLCEGNIMFLRRCSGPLSAGARREDHRFRVVRGAVNGP